MAKTLEELKQENAEAEALESTEAQTVLEGEEVEADEVEAEESEEVAQTESEETEETELEAWMQAEEQTSDDDHGVPVAKHASMRNKLKGTIREQESEIDQLRKQIEELKGSSSPAPSVRAASELPTRPKLDDFDYDEDKYNQAMDAWYDAKLDVKLQSTQQQTQTAQALEKLNSDVDRHYERAEKLIAETGIKPELYRDADTAVRKAIEAVRPGTGDQVADFIISTLGEGSEKVMYYLGRNEAAKASLQAKLVNDPSGLQAMAYLGQVSAKVTTPVKSKTKAPAPAPKAEGDAAVSTSDKAWIKKYKAAKNDPQKSFDVRREARKAGVNTSNW